MEMTDILTDLIRFFRKYDLTFEQIETVLKEFDEVIVRLKNQTKI